MGEICYYQLDKSTCSCNHSKVTKSFHWEQPSFQNLFNLSTKQRSLNDAYMLANELLILLKAFDEVTNSPIFVSGKLGKTRWLSDYYTTAVRMLTIEP